MTPPGVAQRIAMGLIRFYQLTASSITGRGCRYAPTCSSYAAEAIARHGVWNGFWLGLFRVARCHPWGGSGYDPVPGKTRPARLEGVAADRRCATGKRPGMIPAPFPKMYCLQMRAGGA